MQIEKQNGNMEIEQHIQMGTGRQTIIEGVARSARNPYWADPSPVRAVATLAYLASVMQASFEAREALAHIPSLTGARTARGQTQGVLVQVLRRSPSAYVGVRVAVRSSVTDHFRSH